MCNLRTLSIGNTEYRLRRLVGFGASVGWHWQDRKEAQRGTPHPLPLCLPQIPRGRSGIVYVSLRRVAGDWPTDSAAAQPKTCSHSPAQNEQIHSKCHWRWRRTWWRHENAQGRSTAALTCSLSITEAVDTADGRTDGRTELFVTVLLYTQPLN